MVSLKAFGGVYLGKKVLLTGHTGFKGSWLAEWLVQLGAEVHGLALDPTPEQRLFGDLGLHEKLASDHRIDLRNENEVAKVVASIKPDFVFHLGAQPLVRLSYEMPVETFATNVMGTAHVLEGVRLSGHKCTVVIVTTDKCYENREWLHSYREEDAMGGYDPYSASKGAAELVISAYRRSFFSRPDNAVRVASARAGNVIGGGDWALDRIVPDVFRALERNQPVPVRNKTATRPWQHVLEPLSGYLWLGAALHNPSLLRRDDASVFTSGFNFGPVLTSNQTVAVLVERLLAAVKRGNWQDMSDSHAPHEASKLNLAIDKAFHLLQWQPVWNFQITVERTAGWYEAVAKGADAWKHTSADIEHYMRDARAAGLLWAAHA